MSRAAAEPAGPAWYRDLARDWGRALRRRGRAPGTERTYRWALQHFGRWLEHCQVAQPDDLVLEVLLSWQDQLVDQDLTPSGRMVAHTAVRGLLRWGAKMGRVAPGLWDHVESVSIPESLPRTLEPEELRTLLQHYSRAARGLEQLRDRALFLFLLTSGSRITAALSLDRVQLERALTVRQKGGGEHRLIPSAIARRWLQEYLAGRGRDDQPALWIRVGPRGRHRLTAREVNAIWAEVADRLGVPRFTSHWLRGTGATELGETGLSDVELSDIMGWRNPAVAKRYRKVRERRRQELVDRLDDLVPAVPADSPPPRRRPRVRVVRPRRSSSP